MFGNIDIDSLQQFDAANGGLANSATNSTSSPTKKSRELINSFVTRYKSFLVSYQIETDDICDLVMKIGEITKMRIILIVDDSNWAEYVSQDETNDFYHIPISYNNKIKVYKNDNNLDGIDMVNLELKTQKYFISHQNNVRKILSSLDNSFDLLLYHEVCYSRKGEAFKNSSKNSKGTISKDKCLIMKLLRLSNKLIIC